MFGFPFDVLLTCRSGLLCSWTQKLRREKPEPRVSFNIRKAENPKKQRIQKTRNVRIIETTRDKKNQERTRRHTPDHRQTGGHQTVAGNEKRHMRGKLQNKTGNHRRTTRIMTGASSSCLYSSPERTKQTPSQRFWFLFSIN